MTTIPVERELLERITRKFSARPHWDSMNQGQAIAELRTLLAEQPQAGAGQVLPEDLDAVAFCGCRIVHSRKNGNILVQCAQHVAAQRPARHDQGDEVRRLREALGEAVEYLDSTPFNEIGAGSILHRTMRDVLSAHKTGEEE